MNGKKIPRRYFGILFLVMSMMLSACSSHSDGLTEKEAKRRAEDALKTILSVEAEPDGISLEKRQNSYAQERTDSSMSRDAKEYWIANCSFEESDDYQIWMDAANGKVIYIARYPVGWFSQNEGRKDFMERTAGAVPEQTIRDNAVQYCEKAGYAVAESDAPLQYKESITLQKPDGSRTEWNAEYYRTYVMYEDGTGATMALFADDGSLLEAWFAPYE